MPRGARPGERRGGRAKGTPNKYTVGKAWKATQARSLDNTLRDLSMLLIVTVRDPEERHLVCMAIDRYVDARQRATAQERRGRSAVKGVPMAKDPLPELQVPDPMPLLAPEFDLTF